MAVQVRWGIASVRAEGSLDSHLAYGHFAGALQTL